MLDVPLIGFCVRRLPLHPTLSKGDQRRTTKTRGMLIGAPHVWECIDD